MYVFSTHVFMETLEINKVEIRNLQKEDYDQLASSFTRVYADGSDVFWTPKQIDKLIRIFPEGQIVVVVDGKIVGCALSIIVNYDDVKNDHTYAQVTGNETFDTHTRKGNILYGIEVFIHPDYRGLRLARRMYEYRKELCEKLNLKAIMFGGRLPNYHKYAEQMRPKEYIDKVRQREIVDPVLLFQLSNDFHVRKVMRNYLPNDEESRHYACLLQWDNIYYQAPTEEYILPKTTVRVGIVQWQMRSYKTLDDLFEQVEFFVDSVSGYQSDFVLFPEYFNAPLMARFNDVSESEAIRGLAQYTDEIRDRFIALAIKFNINIINLKMIANIMNLKVDIIESEEGPALGGAILAAVGCGEYESVEAAADKLVKIVDTVEPEAELVEKYEKRYQEFRQIYPALKPVFPHIQ